MEHTVVMHTDGSSGSSGWCGWAVVVERSGRRSEFSGSLRGTNQLAELTAVIMAVSMVRPGDRALIVADSQYALNCMRGPWRDNWERRGFVTYDGRPVKYAEAIQMGWRELEGKDVTLRHVRGHVGVPMNERADELAKGARYAAEAGSPEEVTTSGDQVLSKKGSS